MAKENLYTPDCIRTFSGRYVNIFDPNPDTLLIEDIAHSLAHQCRFGGHLTHFYSVAQHSVLCAVRVTALCDKRAALMHDSSEAFLMDIPSPIKKRMPIYKEIEDNLMKVLAAKFGFDYPLDDQVKKADKFMLQTEWDHLMIQKTRSFCIINSAWSIEDSKATFLRHYKAFFS